MANIDGVLDEILKVDADPSADPGTPSPINRVAQFGSQLYIKTGALDTNWTPVTGGGVTTMAAFGAVPNANGATIVGSALTLEPASGSFPGGVSTLAQTFAGSKTLGFNVADKTTIGATASTAIHQFNGGINYTSITTAISYVIDSVTADYYVNCNQAAPITITLPAATLGRRLVIKDISGTASTNNITIARHAAENIEGLASSYILQVSSGCVVLYSPDGTNWNIEG